MIIVALDDTSLREIDKPLLFFSPELAKVVGYLHDQGAASIGIDFLLPGSETTMEYLLPGNAGRWKRWARRWDDPGKSCCPNGCRWGSSRCDRLSNGPFPPHLPWADLGFVDQTVDGDACVRRQRLRRTDGDGVHACLAMALLVKARGLSDAWLATPHLTLDGAPIAVDADACLRINYVGPAGTIRVVPFHEVLAAATQPASGRLQQVRCRSPSRTRSC